MYAIRSFYALPPLDNPEDSRVARLLRTVVTVLFAATILGSTLIILADADEFLFDATFGLGNILLLAGIWWVARSGRLKLAAALVSVLLWLCVTVLLTFHNDAGIDNPVITGYFVVIILAALLLGEQAALIVGALSALTILLLFFPVPGVSLAGDSIGQLVTVVTTLGLTTVLLRFALKSIKEGLADSRRKESALAESNRQLLASREALQTQVVEREVLANALRQKTTQLEHLLQTARHLTASLDTKEVLSRIAAEATDLLSTDGCAIYMLEPDEQTLTPVVSIDREYAEEILAATIRVDNSFTG